MFGLPLHSCTIGIDFSQWDVAPSQMAEFKACLAQRVGVRIAVLYISANQHELFLLANQPGDNLKILHLYWHLQQYLSQSLNNNMLPVCIFVVCMQCWCLWGLICYISNKINTRSSVHTHIHITTRTLHKKE